MITKRRDKIEGLGYSIETFCGRCYTHMNTRPKTEYGPYLGNTKEGTPRNKAQRKLGVLKGMARTNHATTFVQELLDDCLSCDLSSPRVQDRIRQTRVEERMRNPWRSTRART